jgi:hypothetical protein
MRTRTERSVTRALLRCGIAAGPLFLGAATLEGATRPGYEPLRHPISSLALGPGGWQQMANFGVTGSLYLSFAAGLARTGAPRGLVAAVAAVGAGLLGAGGFATDPIGGYPAGTPPLTDPGTTIGKLHDLASTPVFLGVPVAAAVEAVSSARAGERGWAAASAGAGAGMLVAFVLAGAGFSQQPRFAPWGGLFQRVSLATGFGWLSALAARRARALS